MVSRAIATLLMSMIAAGAEGCGDPQDPRLRGVAAVGTHIEVARDPASHRPLLEVAPPALAAPQAGPAPTTVAAQPDELRDAPTDRVVTALRAHPDPDVRRRAVDVYVERVLKGESSEPLFEACAADPDPLVRRWAALALTTTPSEELRPRLALLAASEPDKAVRSILERALPRNH